MKKIYMMILAMAFVVSAGAFDRAKYNFNSGWKLEVGDVPAAKSASFNDKSWKRVTLPAAFNEDEAFAVDIVDLTDTVAWYRKHFNGDDLLGKKVLIEFEGVRQAGDFYINGQHLGLHENGAMAVGFDLTPYIRKGDNVLAVRIDNSWTYREKATRTRFQWNDRNFNANYGGIPKNVFLHVTDMVYQTLPLYSNLGTTGVYIYGSDYDVPGRKVTVNAVSQVKNDSDKVRKVAYEVSVYDLDGKLVKTFKGKSINVPAGAVAEVKASAKLKNVHFWSWGYGYLYTVKTALKDENDVVFDEVVTRTGFRKTQFGQGRIWLNDRVFMVHGYAQRTSNEWPAVGASVPAWLSDYSNALAVESGGNLMRWMHICPWKQDIESCDRVGMPQAMPAGDSEKDRQGRQWEQRTELMRDAIIYNRNNPSIIFYECGNESISREHMLEMKAIRDMYDPYGGRAIGSREMLDIRESEYGGEMLYINKSKHSPMWAMEYCRDEGLRKFWDDESYPYHKEGDGPLHRGEPATSYNHNQDEFAVELVRRWYDYWRERPGTGERVSSGGVKIIFSDTNTHHRGSENYRRSGVTDPMRIPKDGFYAHQVMWNGWVDSETPQTYIVGHWNYKPGTVKTVYVVSNGENVELFVNGKKQKAPRREYEFLFTFDKVAFEEGKLEAVTYGADGVEDSRFALETAGEPVSLKMTSWENPEGFKADGHDLAMIQFEVVDAQGRRCPLDNRVVNFTVEGEGEWRGGIALGERNCVLSKALPVECGVNRALVRSTCKAGKIKVTAVAEGLPEASVEFRTVPVEVVNGMSGYLPAYSLPVSLVRGETPSTPSCTDIRRTVGVKEVRAGSNNAEAAMSFDDNELSSWKSDGQLSNGWITYKLERKAMVDDICLKLNGWRRKSYPLEVYAGKTLIWAGTTEKSLGYVHLEIASPVETDVITISMKGSSKENDAFGELTEVAGNAANELEARKSSKNELNIVEVDFTEAVLSE
ncbi:MAG: glycoside hydrolase family 2 protein [Bacteroidales bacterium]|nr:glycoside hydrolase family 2 protein [Bacteroidales bacterium]